MFFHVACLAIFFFTVYHLRSFGVWISNSKCSSLVTRTSLFVLAMAAIRMSNSPTMQPLFLSSLQIFAASSQALNDKSKICMFEIISVILAKFSWYLCERYAPFSSSQAVIIVVDMGSPFSSSDVIFWMASGVPFSKATKMSVSRMVMLNFYLSGG